MAVESSLPTDPSILMQDPELLDTLTNDFKRLKRQKARPTGGIEARTLLNLAFVHDEQWVDQKRNGIYAEQRDSNKLYLSFNVIKGRRNKLIGRLAALNLNFKASPNKKDPKALSEGEVVDKLILSLDQKLDQPSKLRELLQWIVDTGTAFEYVPWVPNATQELAPVYTEDGQLLFKGPMSPEPIPQSIVEQIIASNQAPREVFEIYEEVQPQGEVGSEILGPLNVFIDQSVHSVSELAPDQWVHVAKIRTVGWVEENFGVTPEPMKDFAIISTQFHQTGDATGGVFLKDLIPLVQGSADENDPPMVVVVEAFQTVSKKNPKGKYVCYIPGQQILHSADNPYGEIPLVDFHWGPVTTSFWTEDYVSSLIAPQRFLNKRVSQLGEQSNAAVYALTLLGGALKASDIPADYPGVVEGGLGENGTPLVQRAMPPEFPSWFMNSLELVIKLFNDIAGGADLFQESKFPGQLRGPMAVPMLQEILDTEWGPVYNHIGERLARVKQMRLNRVKQFYPPIRTLHFTDKDMKDEVMTFHAEKVLGGAVSYNVTVDRGSLVPELRALREARIIERLNGPLAILYMDERTGKLDKSKIASDLQFGDAGREGREAQYRKLAGQLIEMIWKGEQVPPPLPFYDHSVMLDELEAAMATTEFLRASQQIQQLFLQRWEQHRFYLQQEALAQQQAMQNGMIQNAVAQATQQAAAMAAADAVTSTQQQMGAQAKQPTEEFVRAANERGEQRPAERKPSRKFTYEEKN